MSTVTWRASGGGDWDISADWSLDPSLPGSGDAVVVATPGAATITHSQGADDSAASISFSAIDSLTISAGSLTVAGASSIGGTLTLAGGTLELDGDTTVGSLAQAGGLLSGTGTVTVTGPAVLGLSNSFIVEAGSGITDLKSGGSLGGNGVSPFLGLDGGRVLENEGVFAWHSGQISLAANFLGVSVGSATIDNVVGATFDDQTDNTINANPIGTNLFINDGTFKKTAGTGTTNIAIPFNNTGAVEVDSGTLALNGGGASSGSITVASGTALSFGAGSYAITGTLASPGMLQVSGASVSVAQDLTNAGLLNLTSGSLALGGNATLASLTQAGGLLSGPGTVTVTGPAVFGLSNSSIVEAGSGTTDLKAGGSLGGPGFAPGFGLDGGRVLENEGVFAWQSGFIDLGDNALGVTAGGTTIDNAAGAVFDAQNDFPIVTNNIGTDLFINEGTLRKSAGAGTTTIGVALNNTGTVEADSGTLALLGEITGSGQFVIGADAQLELGSAASGAATFNGANATLRLNAPAGFTGAISGFALGDVIDLVNTVATGVSFDGTGLTVSLSSGATLDYDFAGASLDQFNLVSDGHAGSDIIITGVDQPPITRVPGAQAISADETAPIPGISIADADALSANEFFTVTLTDTIGSLSVLGGLETGLDTNHLTIFGSLNLVNLELATLTYLADTTGSDTINIVTKDGRGGSDSHSIGVTVTAFNAPPATTVPGPQTISPNVATKITGVSVVDADAVSAAETITVKLTDGAGALAVNSGATDGGTITGENTTALTISGTLGQVNAYLATLADTNTSVGGDPITVVTDDGRGASDTRTIGVTVIVAGDAPPVTTVPGAQTIVQSIETKITGVSVADADAVSAAETITVKLTDRAGALTVNSGATDGGTIVGEGTTAVTISGTLGQVNTYLATLTDSNGSVGSDTITVATDDGRGGSDAHKIGVTVSTGNAPPVTIVAGPQFFQQGDQAPIPISVADADADSAGETITVALSDTTGLLSADAGAGGGGGTITGSGTTTLTISGTLAQVNADLSSLDYIANGVGTDSIDVATSDGRGGSNDQQVVVGINAPPVTTVPGAQIIDLNRGSNLTPIPSVSVADADAVSASETITVALSDTTGLLSVDNGAGGGGTITGSGTTGLTIEGTLAQVNADLSTLAYVANGFGADSIDVVTSDGRGGSDSRTIGITVTGSNAPPVTTVAGPQLFQQGGQGPIPISVADADADSAEETITVTLSDTTGLLSANAGIGAGGGTITGSGTTKLTISGTLAQVNADLSTLDYAANGVSADSIDIATSDSRGGGDDHQIAVSINATPTTSVPGTLTIFANEITPIVFPSVSITDTDAFSANEFFTVTLTDTIGSLSVLGGLETGLDTNHLTIFGALTLVNLELATLTYLAGTTGSDSIDIVTSDGRGGSDSQSIGVTVTALNAPPVTTVSGQGLLHFLQGSVAELPISVADADALSDGETITVVLSDTDGLFTARSQNTPMPGGGGTVTGSNTTRLTISGTLDQVNADLSTLEYATNIFGVDRIDVATSDGRGGSDDHQIDVLVNAAPVVTVPGPQLVQHGATIAISGISIADADAVIAGEIITARITDTFGLGLLSADTGATGGGTITGSGTTQLVIVGTLDQVNADIKTLTFQGSTAGRDNLEVFASDGHDSGDRDIPVTINAPPVTTVPGAQTIRQNVATKIPGISVADADAISANEIITVDLADTSGLLTATGVGVSGSGSTHLAITGLLGTVNADLSTLTYLRTSFGTEKITVTSDDGRDGVDSHSIGIAIIVPGNALPVTTIPGSQFVQQGAATAISGIRVSDADAASAGETITVTLTDSLGALAAGKLVRLGGGTITGSGTKTLTIVGTLAQVNADLTTLTYLASDFGNDSIDVFTNDGRGGSDDHHIAVNVNAPPVLTVPGPQLVQIAGRISGISVADADAVDAGEHIAVVLGAIFGSLSASANIPSGGGLIAGSNTHSLTIFGTLAQVNADLSTLTYREDNFPLALGFDEISVSTIDNRGGRYDAPSIFVTVNTPPVTVTTGIGVLTVQQFNEMLLSPNPLDPFDSLITVRNQTLNNPAEDNETITVRLTDSSGILFASQSAVRGGGSVDGSGTNSLTIIGTLTQVNADLTTLAYFNLGFGTDSIDVATSDGRGGSDDHHIAVSINAPPVVTVPGVQTVLQGVKAAISGVALADADAVSANETITVTLTDTAGTLSANQSGSGGGGSIKGSGTKTLSIKGTLGQVNADLSTLRYLDKGFGSDSVDIAVTDGHGGGDNRSIDVAVNAPPVTTVPGAQTVQQNVATAISGVTVIDADAVSAGEIVTVTLTDAVGALSANRFVRGGVGSAIIGSGTTELTIAGTLAQVNADLSTLTYLDNSFGTDSLDVVTSDSRGGSNDHHIAVGINAPPVTTVPGAQTVQSGVRTAIDGISVADADAFGPLETITVTLTAAAGALLANKSRAGGGGTINGQGTSTLVIKGTLDQVNADLSTLQYLGRGFETDSIDAATSDGRGGGDDRTIAISVNAPPVTRIHNNLFAEQNVVTAISNVSVNDADAVSAGETITFAIKDMEGVGTLSASATVPGGGGAITGSGTTELSIEGTLAQVNADLSTLTYLGNGFTFGTDDLREITTDDRGGSDASHFVILIVNAQPVTTVPGARTVQSGVASTIDGISVADADAHSPREEITVKLTDTAGALSASTNSGGGGTITGSGTKTLTIKGTLDQVNADLSTLSYLDRSSGTDSIDVATDDGRGGRDAHQIAVSTVAAVTSVATLPGSGEVTTGHNVRITLDMSEPVSVGAAPILLLNDGATASFDTVRSSATALIFESDVAAGQMTTDLVISGIQLSAPTSIQGVAGTNADLSGAGVDLGLRINTVGTGNPGPSGGNFSISGNQELELFGDSSASITFVLGSILKLDASAHFTGQVSGFANPDLIDLSDISFGANTTLGFSANGDNTGGAFNVSDGTHTANITLLGQYMASQFAMSSDGHGGTLITDLPPGQQQVLALPKA